MVLKRKHDKGIVRGNPARTREIILQAALEEFAKNGLGGGRIDVIAERADVNKQALYYHFTNKEGLYSATLQYSYELVRSFDPVLDDEGLPPSVRLERLISGFFDNMREHQNVVALVSEENRLRGRHLENSKSIMDINTPFVSKVSEIYREGAIVGSFRSGVDPLQLWITIVSMCQFYFSNIYTISHILNSDMKKEEMIAQRKAHVVDFILAALRAPG